MNFTQVNNNAGDVNNSCNNAQLTEDEKSVLEKLASAFNAYLGLPDRDSSEDAEACAAIHDLQYIIGMRVARRANPEVWKSPDGGFSHLKDEHLFTCPR